MNSLGLSVEDVTSHLKFPGLDFPAMMESNKALGPEENYLLS